MGLHLTTLLTGAAIGALLTYITKDEEVRKTVERFIDGSIAAFKRFLERITPEQAEMRRGHSGKGGPNAQPPPKKVRVAEKKAVH